ncbi:MAG TPA: FAD-dependent oxidoreductase [Methylomirabilota bacterium]|nr:FAD-dependent oxidoreductase [Methylomirabilota bacterium]
MHEPIIFVIDRDPDILKCIAGALERRFGADYKVLTECSPTAALARLGEACGRGEQVALVIADIWTSEMSGLEWLERAREACPKAARCVLVGWGDYKGFAQVRRALVTGQVETFLIRPCTDPEERLYPVVGEILGRWARAHRPPVAPVLRIIGERWSKRCHEIRDLLERAGIAYDFRPNDSEGGQQILEEVGHTGALPAVIFGAQALGNPTNSEIAAMLGARLDPEEEAYDLLVVGAGPAGLACAVHGAANGMTTLVVERSAVGGQAGTSSMIRNYLGFPRGITGAELAAYAREQAISLGAEIIVTRGVVGLRAEGRDKIVTLAGGRDVRARSVILATGVSYNRLEVDGINALIGKGVFYGTGASEAGAFVGKDVFVVGGGNSAGQAAVHLSRYASKVTLVVRGAALTMSDYLVRQIERTSCISVRYNAQIVRAHGGARLEGLEIADTASRKSERVAAAALFVLIGAGAHTDWLEGVLQRDEHGYVKTGRHVNLGIAGRPEWDEDRTPYQFETSLPGVFAVGDVRHQAPRGVTAAVYEGTTAVWSAREYLAEE